MMSFLVHLFASACIALMDAFSCVITFIQEMRRSFALLAPRLPTPAERKKDKMVYMLMVESKKKKKKKSEKKSLTFFIIRAVLCCFFQLLLAL
jgi:hypothetical protein